MNQIIVGFFKSKRIKRIMLQSCLILLLGMIMLFSMPTVAKSASGVKPNVPSININKIYTENMTYDSSDMLYRAAGSPDQLIKLYMLASDGVWSDDQRALLQAGGATAYYSTLAYTPGWTSWSWYAPYIEHEMWVNQMRYYVPSSTPVESIWMSALQANLNFYENKNDWVRREINAPIPASTFIDTIKANVIQPPNHHYAWGDRDYGWHDTNIFATNIFNINFSGVHPTVVVYKPSATTIISGQTLASSSLSNGSVMSETAYYTPMPMKYGISGTFKWQNPSQQLTTNTTVKAEFDPVYANFAKPDLMDISVTVRAAVVTLDKNGGTGGSASAEGWFNSTLADTAIPTRTGYDFKGYYSAPTDGIQYYNSQGVGVKNWDIAADTTLYAQWEESLSVSDISAPSSILTGSKLILTDPTVIGTTTAKGWEYSANGTTNWIGFDPAVRTFSASENQYYIRYYATNGTYTAYSNTVKITVTKYASALIIEADKTSTTYPGSILLTATLSGVNNFGEKIVKFYDGETFLGQRYVTSSGIAQLLATNPTAGNHSYSVLFEGDTENSSVSSTNINATVSKGTQSAVTFESTADINKTYGDADFTLPTVSGGSSTGAYSYRSDNSEVATLSGNTVSIRGAGVANIYVKRNGDANYNDSAEDKVKIIVAPKAVTIDGIIAYDKVYDGNDNAEIGTGSPSLEGIVNFDDVQIDYSNALAKFADHNAASSISVSFSGFALKGTKAGNYELVDQPAGVHGQIYQREVTISGITAKHKLYDGTQTAVLNLGNVVFNNIIDGDSLTLSATGTFEDANAGDDKIVYIENIVLGGTSVDNYYISSGFKKAMILTQTTTTASIIPKAIVVTPSAGQSKNYGQADGVLTFTNPDYIIEETAVFTGYLGRTAGETVGNYPINLGTLDLADNGAFKAANYIIELSGAIVNYTINSVIATADDYTVTGNEDGWNKDDLIITPNGDYTQISTDKINWSNNLILGTEGNSSTVEFYLKQADGTTTEKATYTYKLDKTAPTATISQNENSWTKFLNNITFGLFFKETKTVSISGADVEGSGIASTSYYILEVDDSKVDLATTLEQAKAHTYTEGTEFNISPDKNIVVFAKIVDNAGNITYINSQGMVFDETAPVISGITNGQTYYTTQALVVTDTNLDNININGDDFVGSTITGDIDITYLIVATDKAGNITTYKVTMKSINSLSATIDSLTEANVKSSDKGAIETVKANVSAVDIGTATQAEKDKLQGITDKCNSLLTKISNIASEIEAVNTNLGDTTKANGKSSDNERLGEVKIEIERLLDTINLTDEERANLEGTLKVTNEVIAEIGKVGEEIAAVTKKLDDTSKANAKSSDSERLGEVKIEIERLLATDNLTAEEITNLKIKLIITIEAIVKIDEVEKTIINVLASISNITQNNVTKFDVSKIDKGIKDLQRILVDYANNLTDTEKAMINTQIKKIQDIRKVLDEVKAVEDLIITLPSNIERVRDSFNKLSAHQQKLIDAVLLAKLDEFLNPKMKAVIIDLATGIKIEGINGTLFNPRTILVLTPIIDTQGFTKLEENKEMLQLYDIKFLLDGKEIQPEGNIKITLKLTQEQQGYKDLKVVFIADDGTVTIIPSEINGDEVSFITDHFSHYGIIGTKVNGSDADRMTDTLDIIAYIVLASIVVTAITIILVKKRKKDTNNIMK
jgi:hypothetical protein